MDSKDIILHFKKELKKLNKKRNKAVGIDKIEMEYDEQIMKKHIKFLCDISGHKYKEICTICKDGRRKIVIRNVCKKCLIDSGVDIEFKVFEKQKVIQKISFQN